MKKLLLLLLACGMCVSASAQPEVPKKNTESSDKWVITPVSTMKGVLGRLDINFPPDVYGDIQIYYQADNKWFTSVSGKSKSYSLAPGVYRFELSSAPVENVPIQKGHETRLKAGFLSVVSEGSWHLYNEAKKKIYASGNTPYKIVLPVGNYQLSLGGQFFPVIIKDGETVEDYSPVEVKEKTPGQITPEVIDVSASAQPEVPKKKIESSEKWVITPVSTMKGVLGRLDINFPADSYGDIQIYKDNKWFTSVSGKSKSYSLAPGVYRFELSSAPVENVPIQKGHETRLKAGFLNVVSEGNWHLYNETKEKTYANSSTPYKMALPVGNYQINLGGQFYPVIIKDGETVEDYSPIEVKDKTAVEVKNETPGNEKLKDIGTNTEAIDPSVYQQWVISPATIKSGRGYGRLTIRAPKDTTFTGTIPITNQKIDILVPVQCITNPVELPVVLPVRNDYKVAVNQLNLINVPIQEGMETRITAGFLVITPKTIEAHTGAVDDLEWAEDLIGATPDRIVLNWELYKRVYDGWELSGKKLAVYALPPGEYKLIRTHPDPMYYNVKYNYRVIIKDGQWTINGERL